MQWLLLLWLVCSNGQVQVIAPHYYDYTQVSYFINGNMLFMNDKNNNPITCTLSKSVGIVEWWGINE